MKYYIYSQVIGRWRERNRKRGRESDKEKPIEGLLDFPGRQGMFLRFLLPQSKGFLVACAKFSTDAISRRVTVTPGAAEQPETSRGWFSVKQWVCASLCSHQEDCRLIYFIHHVFLTTFLLKGFIQERERESETERALRHDLMASLCDLHMVIIMPGLRHAPIGCWSSIQSSFVQLWPHSLYH